jgi:hypothetical protein
MDFGSSWFRIRIGNADPDPSPGASKVTNINKYPEFHPLKMAFVCLMTLYLHEV